MAAKKIKNLVGNKDDEKKRKSATKSMGKKCKSANQDNKVSYLQVFYLTNFLLQNICQAKEHHHV